MISINEFESKADEDEVGNEKILVEERITTDDSPMVTYDNVDVSSDGNVIDTSPVLQFSSQSMANISSPQYPRESGKLKTKPMMGTIRESISSPVLYQQN